MGNVYMAAAPREKHLEYKNDVDTKESTEGSSYEWETHSVLMSVTTREGWYV